MISVIIENENYIENSNLIIREKNDLNHLKNSFRVKIGEKIRGVDGKQEYLLEIIEIEKKEIIGKILEIKEDEFSTEVEIDAAIGMLKNDKMNLTIQKLTEIGVRKIIPFFSKRCIIKINEKKDKWDLVSKEALKQCQGVKFVEIPEPVKLKEINLSHYDLVVIPYEEDRENNLKNILGKLENRPKRVLYIVGPEGGFSQEEIEYFIQEKCKIVTLGRRILRAETASIVVGGVLINEFQ